MRWAWVWEVEATFLSGSRSKRGRLAARIVWWQRCQLGRPGGALALQKRNRSFRPPCLVPLPLLPSVPGRPVPVAVRAADAAWRQAHPAGGAVPHAPGSQVLHDPAGSACAAAARVACMRPLPLHAAGATVHPANCAPPLVSCLPAASSPATLSTKGRCRTASRWRSARGRRCVHVSRYLPSCIRP